MRLAPNKADVDLLKNDGRLPESERLVPCDLGQVDTSPARVVLGDLGARRESLLGRDRRRGPPLRRVVRLGPVPE